MQNSVVLDKLNVSNMQVSTTQGSSCKYQLCKTALALGQLSPFIMIDKRKTHYSALGILRLQMQEGFPCFMVCEYAAVSMCLCHESMSQL